MNAKILILGGNSFIARSIKPLFNKSYYSVDSFTRQELDLRDLQQLKNCLKKGNYDLVINCAISGQGRLLKKDSVENFYENILMHENILSCNKYYSRLIDFTSGAEYNRQEDIVLSREYEEKEPCADYYALAKRVNSYRTNQETCINLRIFNVFGPLERENRFIKTCILNCINGYDINIWGDAKFDFFYIGDLFILIDFIIQRGIPYASTEINCVYKKKYTLLEIANIIKDITGSSSNINVEGFVNRQYTGNGARLESYNLKLCGLEEGIRKTYLCLNQEKK